MLDPISRGAIVLMSSLCICGAFAFAPLRARSSNEPPLVHRRSTLGTALTALAVADIDIRRDPFAVQPSPQPIKAVADGPSVPSPARDELRPLPSNLAVGTVPAIPGTASGSDGAPRVTAIVTGPHPYAMFDTVGNHEIKGVGDRVHGTPIVLIDIDGVTLQGGERLTLTPGELPR